MNSDRASKAGGKVALMCIDLDRFKEVNDLHGHVAGDEVLRVLGQRMDGILREGEFVARLGGDEFAAVKRLQAGPELAIFSLGLNARSSSRSRWTTTTSLPARASAWQSIPDNGSDKATLVGNADLAMYRAKATLNKAVAFYEKSMDETVRERKTLASELRDAVDADQLEIHYQVQTSIATGGIRGYEALVRWKHRAAATFRPASSSPSPKKTALS